MNRSIHHVVPSCQHYPKPSGSGPHYPKPSVWPKQARELVTYLLSIPEYLSQPYLLSPKPCVCSDLEHMSLALSVPLGAGIQAVVPDFSWFQLNVPAQGRSELGWPMLDQLCSVFSEEGLASHAPQCEKQTSPPQNPVSESHRATCCP